MYEIYKENSRDCPGKKEFVKVKHADGSREEIQKSLLLNNLEEIYANFKEQYPNEKIGFTKFCSLRPENFVLIDSKDGAHNVCVCVYHQNLKLLLEAANLEKLCFDDEEKILNYKDIINLTVCKEPTENCFYVKCKNCPGFDVPYDKLKILFEKNNISSITVKQWVKQNSWEYETMNLSILEYLTLLKKQFVEKFLTHNYITKRQSDYIKTRKQNLLDYEALVMMDFAENYTCIHQDSIQSHYWGQTQVTVHPFAVYTKQNNELIEQSLVAISENSKDHDIYSISMFQSKLINFIKNNYENRISKIIYVSDGASSQYKNIFNFYNLLLHYSTYKIEAEWHFFATSHGKSACDGIGGTVKRLARRASLLKKDIGDAKKMYDWALIGMQNTNFAFFSTKDYEASVSKLKPILEKAVTIQGTLGYHSFIPVAKENTRDVVVRCTSDSQQFIIKSVLKKC